jgi:ubiquinone/menaquinone biosynthesis C-methylase UbiE
MTMPHMPRQPEPELMDLPEEALAYAEADFHDVNQAFVDRLVQLAGPSAEAKAVDLGCGPAEIPILAARARPLWHITAVDASEAMLALAREAVQKAGLSNRVTLHLADAKATGLGDAAFDIVFSNSILHHVEQPVAFWAELRRIAAPGAMVLLRDLARPRTPKAARDLVAHYAGSESRLLRDEFYRSLLSAYTPGEVREQLAATGLGQLTVEMVTDRHLDVYGRL